MAGSGKAIPSKEFVDLEQNMLNADSMVNSVDFDFTNRSSPNGNQKTTTFAGMNKLASDQRDNFEATFQTQFAYKRIGNISLYVGDSLPEADKLNSYQYPDDSGEWYGPIQGQSFPIIIPADPSNDDGWALVSAASKSYVEEYAIEQSKSGDSQLSNGLIFPESSVDLIPLGSQLTQIPDGVSRLRVATGVSGGELLYPLEFDADYPTSAKSISNIVSDGFGGWVVTTNQGVYTFLSSVLHAARNQGDLLGWGAAVNSDYTDPLKEAIDQMPKGSTIYLRHPFKMGTVPVRKDMNFNGMNVAEGNEAELIGANAGFLVGGRIKEVHFENIDAVCNGVMADYQVLIQLAIDADVDNISYKKCKSANTVVGLSMAFENGRKLRGKGEISECHIKSTIGDTPGHGYGLHYCTDKQNGSGGEIVVFNNIVDESTRHGLYATRSGHIKQWANTVNFHRLSNDNGDIRGAMDLSRAKNVQSWGNTFKQCRGGCVVVSPETVGGTTYDADNITIWGDLYDEPKGTVPPFVVGLSVNNGGTIKSISNTGSTFRMQDNPLPVCNFYRGRNITFTGATINYRGITTPTNVYVLSPTDESPGTANNSDGWTIDNEIFLEGVTDNVMSLYRIVGNTGVRMDLNDRVIGTSAYNVVNASTALTQANVYMKQHKPEVSSGLVSKRYVNPSQDIEVMTTGAAIPSPVGQITPDYVWQELFLTSNNTKWQAFGLTNQDWVKTGG